MQGIKADDSNMHLMQCSSGAPQPASSRYQPSLSTAPGLACRSCLV